MMEAVGLRMSWITIFKKSLLVTSCILSCSTCMLLIWQTLLMVALKSSSGL